MMRRAMRPKDLDPGLLAAGRRDDGTIYSAETS